MNIFKKSKIYEDLKNNLIDLHDNEYFEIVLDGNSYICMNEKSFVKFYTANEILSTIFNTAKEKDYYEYMKDTIYNLMVGKYDLIKTVDSYYAKEKESTNSE